MLSLAEFKRLEYSFKLKKIKELKLYDHHARSHGDLNTQYDNYIWNLSQGKPVPPRNRVSPPGEPAVSVVRQKDPGSTDDLDLAALASHMKRLQIQHHSPTGTRAHDTRSLARDPKGTTRRARPRHWRFGVFERSSDFDKTMQLTNVYSESEHALSDMHVDSMVALLVDVQAVCFGTSELDEQQNSERLVDLLQTGDIEMISVVLVYDAEPTKQTELTSFVDSGTSTAQRTSGHNGYLARSRRDSEHMWINEVCRAARATSSVSLSRSPVEVSVNFLHAHLERLLRVGPNTAKNRDPTTRYTYLMVEKENVHIKHHDGEKLSKYYERKYNYERMGGDSDYYILRRSLDSESTQVALPLGNGVDADVWGAGLPEVPPSYSTSNQATSQSSSKMGAV